METMRSVGWRVIGRCQVEGGEGSGHRASRRSSLITRRSHRAEPRTVRATVRIGPSALSRRAGDSGPGAAPPTPSGCSRPAGLRRAGPADLGGRGRRPAPGSGVVGDAEPGRAPAVVRLRRHGTACERTALPRGAKRLLPARPAPVDGGSGPAPPAWPAVRVRYGLGGQTPRPILPPPGEALSTPGP